MNIAAVINSGLGRATMLGLALGASVLPAAAGGDVIYGQGLRQAVPAAVPVPAPIPVPDVASNWYFRLDAAYGFNNVDRYRGSLGTLDQNRADDNLSNFGRFGIGAGYHFSRWLRSDVTLDTRGEVKSTASGYVDRNGPTYTNPITGVTGPIAMRDTVSDSFRTKSWTGLFNTYLDLPVTPTFTPYVGAGVGWVLHTSTSRAASVNTACIDGTNCDPAAGTSPGGLLVANNPGYTLLNSVYSGKGPKLNDLQLAAAFMAGFTYNVSDSGKIDIGYRLLHMGGTTFTTQMSNGVAARMTIPDQNVSEIRVGYRYELN